MLIIFTNMNNNLCEIDDLTKSVKRFNCIKVYVSTMSYSSTLDSFSEMYLLLLVEEDDS